MEARPLRRRALNAAICVVEVAVMALSAVPLLAQIAPAAPRGQPQLPLAADYLANPVVYANGTTVSDANKSVASGVGINAPEGSFIFVSVAMQSGTGVPYVIGTPTDNNSNTYTTVANKSIGDVTLTVFMAGPVPKAEAHIVITSDLTRVANVTEEAVAVTNINRVSPIDQVEQLSGSGSPAIVSVTPTQTHEVFLAPFAAATHSAVTFSPPQYSEGSASPDHAPLRAVLTYADNNTTGAFQSSYTLPPSTNYLSFLISLEHDPTPPAPTGLTLGAVTATTVALTWTNPAGGYADGLTNDSVQYGHTPTGPFITVSIGSVAASDTVTGLSCDQPYYFQVAAWNSTGASLPSGQVFTMTASSSGCVVNLYGNQTAANYANKTVNLYGGNFTCSSGTLLFDNDTLLIKQNYSGSATKIPLENGIFLRSSCSLTVKYSTVGTNSTAFASYPTFIDQSGSGTGTITVLHSELEYFGSDAAMAGFTHTGVFSAAPHARFANDTFYDVHELYFTDSFTGSSITGSTFDGATFDNPTNATVFVSGDASWFNFTGDTWLTQAEDMEMLWVAANHTHVSGDDMEGNVSTANLYGVLFYDNSRSAVDVGSHSTLTHTKVDNAGVQFKAQSDPLSTGGMEWLNVTYDNFTSTPNAATRNSFELYFDGSSGTSGDAGIYVRHVVVQHDAFSNWTGQDALRFGTNVTNVNCSYNVFFDLATGIDPSANGKFSYGIYLVRNVQNATVYDNTLSVSPLYDTGTNDIATYGINLEADIRNVNVSDNRVYNFTAVAYDTQGGLGSYSAPTWYKLPDSGIVEYDNVAENFIPANYSANNQECFADWDGANFTQWVGNYCRYDGWAVAPNVYNGFAFHIAAEGNYIANNTAVDANGFLVFTKNSNIETPGSAFHTRWNTLFDNTWTGLTLTQGAAVVSDVSSGWTQQNNNVSGNVGNASWSFDFVTGPNGTSSIHLVNTVLQWLNTSSVLYTRDIYWYGPTVITLTGTDYHFNLTRWNTTAAKIGFGALSLATPVLSHSTADWLNLTPTNDSPLKGDYNVSVGLTVAGKLWINDTAAIDHDTYLLLVNRAELFNQVAGASGVAFLVSPASSAEYGVVQVGVPTVPLPPTGLMVASFTNASVSLSWTAPAGTVTDYVVEYGTSPLALTSTYDAGINLTATITGLLPGTAYWFAVIAYNATGPSSPSNVVEQTTAGIPPPPLVGNLSGLVFLAVGVTIVAAFILYVTLWRKRGKEWWG